MWRDKPTGSMVCGKDGRKVGKQTPRQAVRCQLAMQLQAVGKKMEERNWNWSIALVYPNAMPGVSHASIVTHERAFYDVINDGSQRRRRRRQNDPKGYERKCWRITGSKRAGECQAKKLTRDYNFCVMALPAREFEGTCSVERVFNKKIKILKKEINEGKIKYSSK